MRFKQFWPEKYNFVSYHLPLKVENSKDFKMSQIDLTKRYRNYKRCKSSKSNQPWYMKLILSKSCANLPNLPKQNFAIHMYKST